MKDPLTLDEALSTLARKFRLLPVEMVPTAEALGRVLAQDVEAAASLPPFDQSTMDGYALLPDTTSPASLRPAIFAGDEGPLTLGPGEAAYVATGGRVPAGCGVIMQEDVSATADEVRFDKPPAAGDNVRRNGEELQAGEKLASAGATITSGLQALMLALAQDELAVRRRPHVLVVSTGSELSESGPVAGAMIRNTNGPYLAAELGRFGAVVERMTVPDDVAVFREEVGARLTDADLVVSTGGISVGPKDHVAEIAAGFDFVPVFRGVTLRPGRPLSAFRRADGVLWLALPGNPLATALGMDLFVRPALRLMLGGQARLRWTRARLSSPLGTRPSSLDRFWPCSVRIVEGEIEVDPAPYAPSGAVRPFAALGAWVRLPAGGGPLGAGSRVETLLRPGWQR